MQLTHLASPHRAVMTSQRVVVMSNLDGGRRQMLHVLSLMALSQASLRPAVALDGVALDGVAPGYNPGQLPSELGDVALGGLKPGTGRPLNALIKMRAETGIERVSPGQSPLFKAGQIFDELKTAQGGIASVVFAYPEEWTLAGGPNLDVRNVKESDSAFVLAAPLPLGKTIEILDEEFFLNVIFDPQGKYGQYGAVDDRKVVSFEHVSVTLPTGGQQAYARIDLKFAPLSYNQNTVQRRALISATAVGGTVFICVAGSLANRYKTLQPELASIQQSFRALGNAARASSPS
jgi:hypothetical protein